MIFVAWTIQDVKLLQSLSCHSEEKIIVISLRLSSYCYAKYCGFTVVGLWQVPFFASLLFWKKIVNPFNVDTKFYRGLSIKQQYFDSSFSIYQKYLARNLVGSMGTVFLTGTSRLSEQAIGSYFDQNEIIYWEAGINGTIYMSKNGVNADADFRFLAEGDRSQFSKLFSQTCRVDQFEKITKIPVLELFFKVIDGLYLVVLRYLFFNKEVDEILGLNLAMFRFYKKDIKHNLNLRYFLFVDQVEQDTNSTHFGIPPSEIVIYLKHIMESNRLEGPCTLIRRAHPRQLITAVSQQLRGAITTQYIDGSGMDLMEALLNAKLIITVNSTVGVEALMHGKPVVLLGKSYFDRLYGVLTPEDGIRYASGDLLLDSDKIKSGITQFLDNCFIPIDYRRGEFFCVHGFDDFLYGIAPSSISKGVYRI